MLKDQPEFAYVTCELKASFLLHSISIFSVKEARFQLNFRAMNNFKPSTPTRTLSKRQPQYRFPFIPISVVIFLLCFLFFYYNLLKPSSVLPVASNTFKSQSLQCSNQALAIGERFLWYAPHSGFSNQLSEFKNAILMAGILNRTLIVPPVLDHHAAALGSCPKFRVVDADEIRISVWNNVVELMQGGRYISIAEIIDISSLVSSSLVRVIDLRDFVSIWCGFSLDLACFTDSKAQSSILNHLTRCGSLLAGVLDSADKCVYAVNEDCRTTVWTYHSGDKDGMLDSFQADEKLKSKKNITYVRRRRDVYKALGPGSEVESSSLLAFGSLFTAPYKGSHLYIDIHESPQDKRFQSLTKKVKYLPFVPEIMNAAKEFVNVTIKAPFFCTQLRLLDGQFKNHWKATFHALKQKLEALRQKGNLPIHIFIMTDLPGDKWADTYLGDLVSDSLNYRVHFLAEDNGLIRAAVEKLKSADYGQRFIPSSDDKVGKKHCSKQMLPDILLYVEQAVCCCASLGFVGTAGSTIAENIELMRQFGSCSALGQS